MRFAALNASAIKRAVSVMGQSFLYNGKTYQGVVNELALKQQAEIGGFEDVLTAQVTVAKAEFPAPTIGAKVTVNGSERRIMAFDQDQISYTLHLDSPHR